MVMDTVQVRLSHGLIDSMDSLVDTGIYSSRSDVVRDAVRRLVLDKLVGIIPNTGDSVKEMKEIKKKLSKEIKSFKDIKEINKLIN